MKLLAAAGALIVLLQLQSPPRTGVVSGRVLAPNGEPLVSMQVFLFSRSYDQKGRPVGRGAATDTNDRGEYRFFSVAPGRYYLYVKWSDTSLVMQHGAESIRQVDARASNGRRFSPTYYAGAADMGQASHVDVGPGEERSGVDVVMLPPSPASQQTWAVRGRLFEAATGNVPRIVGDAAVYLSPRESATGWWTIATAHNPSADGKFEFLEIAAGKYWLSAKLDTPAGAMSTVTAVDVAGDVSDLVLRMTPPLDIAGKVTLDERPLSAADARALKVKLTVTTTRTEGPAPAAPIVNPDGTFSVPDVRPGEYDIVLTGVPANAYVAQMRYGGTAVDRQTLFLSGNTAATLEISLSAKAGQLSGRTVPKAEVVLIPEGSPKLPERYKTVTADADGKFLIRGIAPGAYSAYSFAPLPRPFVYFDPLFIRDFETQGQRIQIDEGKRAEVDLEVSTK